MFVRLELSEAEVLGALFPGKGAARVRISHDAGHVLLSIPEHLVWDSLKAWLETQGFILTGPLTWEADRLVVTVDPVVTAASPRPLAASSGGPPTQVVSEKPAEEKPRRGVEKDAYTVDLPVSDMTAEARVQALVTDMVRRPIPLGALPGSIAKIYSAAAEEAGLPPDTPREQLPAGAYENYPGVVGPQIVLTQEEKE